MYVIGNKSVVVNVPKGSPTVIGQYHLEVRTPTGSIVFYHPTAWDTAVSSTVDGVFTSPLITFTDIGSYSITAYYSSSADLDTNVTLTKIGMTSAIKVDSTLPLTI